MFTEIHARDETVWDFEFGIGILGSKYFGIGIEISIKSVSESVSNRYRNRYQIGIGIEIGIKSVSVSVRNRYEIGIGFGMKSVSESA